MALKFYIQVKGKVSGPLSGSELMSLAQSGKLLPTNMVRQDGSDNWVKANRIRNLEFGTPQEEPEEEIEEILEVDPDPILPPVRDLLKPHRRWGRAETTPPLGQLSSPIKPAPPIRQTNKPITEPKDNLPPPPDYGFVQTVATMYNTMGVLTLIGSFFAVLSFGSKDSGGKDSGGQKESLILGIIIFGAISSITCFAMAQLFTMAINGSKNLHYIMHSNIVAMRVIVNQFSKKE